MSGAIRMRINPSYHSKFDFLLENPNKKESSQLTYHISHITAHNSTFLLPAPTRPLSSLNATLNPRYSLTRCPRPIGK